MSERVKLNVGFFFRYLTGLTRTGAAIEHVIDEAFTEYRGARPLGSGVPRILIVITDGRSQDDVTVAAHNARMKKIELFAVGITNHVLDSELQQISGTFLSKHCPYPI